MPLLSKSDLRSLALERRSDVTPDAAERAASSIATQGLDLVRRFLAPRAPVAVYWPIRREISPRPLMRILHQEGYAVLLPVIGLKGTPLAFRLWTPDAALTPSAVGVPQPGPEAPVMTPEFIFAPLAAFDSRGARIGYGGGHYDATLRSLRESGAPLLAAGLAYALQEVPQIPTEPHDQMLDFVLTENGLHRTTPLTPEPGSI